jgi:transposase
MATVTKTQKKASQRRKPEKPSKALAPTSCEATQSQSLQCLYPHSAGIDVGAFEMVAALPPGRNPRQVRTFETFTSGVHGLRDWLKENGITTVAMESTSNYWIMLYDVLVEAGIDVYLVNARHVRGVPGRKTDVCDAQWLQQLHSNGLLQKSFRPRPPIAALRYVMRHRGSLSKTQASSCE